MPIPARKRREMAQAEWERWVAVAYSDPDPQPCPSCGAPTIIVELSYPELRGLRQRLSPQWAGEYRYKAGIGWVDTMGTIGTHTQHVCGGV